MISHDDALACVLANVRPLALESMAIERALGLALARPVKSRTCMPRFDQSAMDGIAVRCDDVVGASEEKPVPVSLIGEMPAGFAGTLRLRPGTAVKVFTGSPIPSATEAVVMVERCRFEADVVHVQHAPRVGENVRRAGEEISRGDVLLDAGTPITPPVVGLLAHAGVATVSVRPRPRIGLVTMGDEVAAPGAPLGRHQVHDANGPALRAALAAMGFDHVKSWHVDDRPRSLVRQLARALETCDVVLTAGGASVGDHDHVESARAELGIRERFARIAIKPGKPNVFGLAGRKPVFSLPGNPVSALVSFHSYVRPALRAMLGLEPAPIRATMDGFVGSTWKKKPGRTEWVRVNASLNERGIAVERLDAQGSHMLSGLARADALARFESEDSALAAGDAITIRWLDWT